MSVMATSKEEGENWVGPRLSARHRPETRSFDMKSRVSEKRSDHDQDSFTKAYVLGQG
jgi:hypothetical protein